MGQRQSNPSETSGALDKVELVGGKLVRSRRRREFGAQGRRSITRAPGSAKTRKNLSLVTDVFIDTCFPEISDAEYKSLCGKQKFAIWAMSTSLGKNLTKDLVNRIIDDVNNETPVSKTLVARMIAKNRGRD